MTEAVQEKGSIWPMLSRDGQGSELSTKVSPSREVANHREHANVFLEFDVGFWNMRYENFSVTSPAIGAFGDTD